MLNRPSKAVMTRVTVGIVALLAALMLPLMSHDVGHAQEAPIAYPERGTTPVASFTAIDPETGSSIQWSLVTAAVDSANVSDDDVADHGNFTISTSGVLSFKSPPNYEDAKDAGGNNEYKVTVQARGSGSGDTAYYEVVVNVTNIEEDGTVTLSTLQPQVRVGLTASVSDPDLNVTGTTWQWYNSSDMSTWDEIEKATQAAYMPAPSDAGKYLRAVATYTDDKENPEDDPATMDVDESKDTAMAVSAAVLPSTAVNDAPDFKDEEGESRPDEDPDGNDDEFPHQVRINLKESATGGDDVGNPVAAVDDDTLTYTMADDTDETGDDADLFTIDTASAQISVKAGTKFDFTGDDSPGTNVGPFNVIVTATDPTGATDSVTVVITITDVNEKPSIEDADDTENQEAGLAAITRPEGTDTALTGATYTAMDSDNPLNDDDTPAPENDALEWTLSGPDAGKFNLPTTPGGNADTGLVATLAFKKAPNYEAMADADGNNDYEVTVVVTDSAGNKATRDVTVTITNAEEPGSVKVSLLRPQIGTMLVAEVSDPDQDVSGVTWQWWRTTDGDDTTALTDVPDIADFDDIDEDPPANRRGDGDPNEGNATDWEKVPGGTSSSYRPVAADTGKFLLAIATYADGKSNIEDDSETDDVDETESDRASLVVGDTDPDSNVETDTLAVRVVQTSNSAPKFPDTDPVAEGDQNDPRERRVKENTSGFVGTAVTAEDDDTAGDRTDTVTYSLGGPDGDLFEINQRSGQISVGAGTKLDFEAEKNTYEVTVIATDPSGAAATTTVNIIVTNVNEKPTITLVDGSQDYAENGMAPVASFTAEDPETESAIQWSLVTAAVDSANVSDDDVADHGNFTISTSGVLEFKNPPNYEDAKDAGTNNEYKVTVQARGSGSGDTAYYEVVVNVTNVEEDGTVSLTTLQPQVRVRLTARVSDPDLNVTGTTWQWYNSSDMSTWAEIEDATQATYRPAASDAGKYLRAVATYTDDKENPEDDPATMDVDESKDTAMAVSAAVLPSTAVNDAPDFKDEEGESRPDEDPDGNDDEFPHQVRINLKENATGGDDVGNPVTAVDDDTLTYTMADDTDETGDDADLFTIDTASAQISVKAGTKFDFTGDDSPGTNVGPFNVIVTATDPTGATDSVTVVITITDVNEKPSIEDADDTENQEAGLAAITRPEGTDTALTGATYTAMDSDNPLNDDDTPAPENDALEWTLSGPDAGKFNLPTTPGGNADTGLVATLAFKKAPNYEAMADADGNNDYEVTVVVTDSAGNKATRDVTVTITNAEEPGSVKVSLLRPQIGTMLVAEVSDPDQDVSGVTWQWWRTTDGDDTTALTDVPDIADFDDIDEDPPANRRGDGDPNEGNATDWEKVPGGTSSSYRPVEADTGKFLLAIATYADGKSNTEDDAETDDVDETESDRASLVVGDTDPDSNVETDTLAVRVVQTSNSAPKFPDTDPVAEGDQNDPRERRVKENTSGFVGTAVTAEDDDTAGDRTDTVTYSLGGPDGDLFEINQRSGQISVGAGTKLDFEAEKNTYEVTVIATDPSGAAATTTVNIIVTNVNEAPKITFTPGGSTPPSEGVVGGNAAHYYRENGTGAVGTYTTTITSPTWSLSGVDAGAFSISGGVLSFNSPPDYENPTDANGDRVYMVTVMANNGNGGATRDVTVTVTNDTSDDPTTPPVDTFDPLSYDADGSGEIDRPEVITAIRHYFADQITRDEVLAVIKAYFGS